MIHRKNKNLSCYVDCRCYTTLLLPLAQFCASKSSLTCLVKTCTMSDIWSMIGKKIYSYCLIDQ